MQKYSAIEKGIENNDVKALREAIGSICYTNRDFSNGEFDEVVKYVEAKGIHLKDIKLIGSPAVSSQKSEFTDEDFAKAIFELKRNFCDERIQDVKTIGKKLYSKKVATPQPSIAKSPAQKAVTERNNSTRQARNVGTLPNARSHQQNNSKTSLVIGLVAIMVIVLIILLVSK